MQLDATEPISLILIFQNKNHIMLSHLTKIAMLMVFFLTGVNLNAQTCSLVKDSVYQGIDSSAFAVYTYNAGNLTTIEYTDSAGTSIQTTDSILYGTNGKQSALRSYDAGLSSIFRTSTVSYDANDRVSRIHVLEDDGINTSTIAHDVSYNASNEITSIKVDSTSITGIPEVFSWNFENMVWQNGNIKSVDLIGNITGSGIDTIELTIENDTMLNVRRHLPIEDVGSIIEQISANNIQKLVTVNDESFGLAGTLALDQVYTYHSNGEVRSIKENVALFNEEEKTTGYAFQCSGIGLVEKSFKNIRLYPIPANNEIHLESDEVMKSIRLYSVKGKLLLEEEIMKKRHDLLIESFHPGVYILEISADQKMYLSKVIVD